jgi:FKBP-type peptidyl-prolyl cis-trans isomerase FklB
MKKTILFSFLLVLGLGWGEDLQAQKSKKNTKATNSAKVDSLGLSFSYGMLLGMNLKMQGISADSISDSDLIAGMREALKGTDTDAKMERAQEIFGQKMQEAQKRQEEASLKNEKVWFDENAKKNKNVQTLASGIQYEILKNGEGDKPSPTSKVTTHYHGTLIDGKVFDSSVDRGQPASFPVNGVIKGWQEILVMMPLGSKWKVYIPSSLAYGSRPVGSIPPNSILIFEIELLKIES